MTSKTFRVTSEANKREMVIVAREVRYLSVTREGYTVIHFAGDSALVVYEPLATVEDRLNHALCEEDDDQP